MSPSIPPKLVDEILSGNCVAFVGAGLTSPIYGDWKKFLTELAKDLPIKQDLADMLKSGNALDYQVSAQLIEDHYGDAKEFERRVSETFKRLESKTKKNRPDKIKLVEERLAKLNAIPFRAIITLNMDPKIEASPFTGYRDIVQNTQSWWDYSAWKDRTLAQKHILKIHGDANNDSSDNPLIFSRRAYRKHLYENGTYTNFLRTLFMTRTVLYLGFSFTDAYINELRSEVLACIRPDEKRPSGYAIMNDRSQLWQEQFLKYEGIEILNYKTKSEGNHDGFDKLLSRLKQETSPIERLKKLLEACNPKPKKFIWVDPNVENNAYGYEILNAAEVSIIKLSSPNDLNAEEHAGANLMIIRHGFGQGRKGYRAEAHETLQKVSRWDERPPVIVFAAPMGEDKRHLERANRQELLRRGAWEYATTWSALFGLIERLFGD